MTHPSPITRAGAQRDAQRELSKSIYHRESEPLPVRALRAVGRLIDHVLHRTSVHAPAGNAGVLAIVVVIVVVVVIVFWRVGVPRRAAAMGGVLAPGEANTAAQHRALAEQAAAGGDWHTAVVERMRAIARELEERSVLEPRPGRTATELARETAPLLPSAAAGLGRSAEEFNSVAYGGAEANAEQLNVLVATDETVRASARSQVLVQ
jgi:Domain of unknown function (DUF4129)